MGMSYSIFCGPAAICKPGQTQVAKTKESVCPQCSPIEKSFPQIPSQGVKKFCPSCGTRLVDYTFLANDVQSVNDIQQKMDYSLSARGSDDINEHMFIPNAHRPPRPRQFNFDSHGDVLYESLSPTDVSLCIQWFIDSYVPEMQVLFDAYGRDNVSVRFVVFGYWY